MPDIREFDEMWEKYATANFGFPDAYIAVSCTDANGDEWLSLREGGGAYKWRRCLPLQRDGLGDPGADPVHEWDVPHKQSDYELQADPTNPDYYKFPNGAETIDITEWLSGCGAQAVQYIVRATRTDGKVKGDPIEDLTKTLWFIEREIARLTAQT